MTDAYDSWLDGETPGEPLALFEERIGKLGLRPALMVSGETPIAAAIELMNAHKVGCVLVGSERIEGIFTERDVLQKVIPQGAAMSNTPVRVFMTENPQCAGVDDMIGQALNCMLEGGFRHVPVVDASGRPSGVFSMRSFMDLLVDLFPAEILNAPPPGLHWASTREGA